MNRYNLKRIDTFEYEMTSVLNFYGWSWSGFYGGNDTILAENAKTKYGAPTKDELQAMNEDILNATGGEVAFDWQACWSDGPDGDEWYVAFYWA